MVTNEMTSRLGNESHNSEAWNYSAFSLRNGFSQERAFNRSLTTATVEVIPLDQIPEVQNLDDLRVLKVDVEGMELEVLAASKQTIQRHCPILFIENQGEADPSLKESQSIPQYFESAQPREFKMTSFICNEPLSSATVKYLSTDH